MKILLVEDSTRLRETLSKALTRLGHAVDVAEDGTEGNDMGRMTSYDVIVLDRMMPGMDGMDVLEGWRRDNIQTPVLLLTALNAIEEKVKGLRSGADDYLTKPFSIEELVARLESLARRPQPQITRTIEAGTLLIDLAAKTVTSDGHPVELTAREFSLLDYLARHPGQTLSREQIENHLYGGFASPLSNAVDSTICSLRRKLFPAGTPGFIHTRRGLGYVLEA
ncbi:response regulator transcription factor [Verrucomicrobiaceae bacterium 227]